MDSEYFDDDVTALSDLTDEEIEAELDRRPAPKPRKRPQLWQTYLIWNELIETRKRHTLRIKAVERGKSNLNVDIEKRFLARIGGAYGVDDLIKEAKSTMVAYGEEVGEIWNWLISIKGLKAGGLAAQLLAQIDDIGKFDNISKLWRFSGYAVVDGRAERNKKGKVSPYNRRLKSICWLIADQFVKQRAPVYRDIYDEEKKRLRTLYPEPIDTPEEINSLWPKMYTDSHIDRMARRKTAKIFLSHLWVKWRGFEGLPITDPYVEGILNHKDIIRP